MTLVAKIFDHFPGTGGLAEFVHAHSNCSQAACTELRQHEVLRLSLDVDLSASNEISDRNFTP